MLATLIRGGQGSHSVPFLPPQLNIAPDDYTAISSQPVTFSSAPDQICISISISDDEVVEETESFALTLDSLDPAIPIMLPFASVTIIDSTGKYLFVLTEIRSLLLRHQKFGFTSIY